MSEVFIGGDEHTPDDEDESPCSIFDLSDYSPPDAMDCLESFANKRDAEGSLEYIVRDARDEGCVPPVEAVAIESVVLRAVSPHRDEGVAARTEEGFTDGGLEVFLARDFARGHNARPQLRIKVGKLLGVEALYRQGIHRIAEDAAVRGAQLSV